MENSTHSGNFTGGYDPIPWRWPKPDTSFITINAAIEGRGRSDWNWWMGLFQLCCIAAGTVYLFCVPKGYQGRDPVLTYLDAPREEASDSSDASSDGSDSEIEALEPVKKKPRMAHLDGIKVVLTFLVVLFHVSLVFRHDSYFMLGILACKDVYSDFHECLDNSFMTVFAMTAFGMFEVVLMALYFFVSGYFTPSSLDKKGVTGFLRDRFLRLGIPALVWFFLVGPLLCYMVHNFIFGIPFRYGEKYTWILGGPPWFIVWLLTFSVAYAFSEGEPVKMRLPGVGRLLTFGFLVGVLGLACPGTSFCFVPLGFAELMPCFVFFAGGCVAKRNNWMEQLAELQGSTHAFLRVFCLLLIVAVYLNGVSDEREPFNLVYSNELRILAGFLCVAGTMTTLDTFSRIFIERGKFLKFLSDAAYGVYLIHPLVFIPISWSWVLILWSMGVPVTKTIIPGNCGVFMVKDPNASLLWLGWLYTLVLTVIIVWPVAHGITRLPGLRGML